MKNKFFILLFAGLLITACSDDAELYAPTTDKEVVSVEQSPELQLVNPHLKGKPITRPMKVKGSGDIQYGPFCDDGIIFVQIIGKGTATHLGKFDLYLSYCRSLIPGVPGTSPEGYQTAANGDILYTNLRIDENGDPVEGVDENGYFQVYDYNGGTGRFEEATGWVKLYFTFDPLPPSPPTSYSNYGQGELTY